MVAAMMMPLFPMTMMMMTTMMTYQQRGSPSEAKEVLWELQVRVRVAVLVRETPFDFEFDETPYQI